MNRWYIIPLAVLFLAGCVSNSPSDNRQFYAYPSKASLKSRIIPWTTIAGYLHTAQEGKGSAYKLITGDTSLGIFDKPVAITSNKNNVYIVDSGSSSLYRFTWNMESHDTLEHTLSEHDGLNHPALERIAVFESLLDPTDIYVTDDDDIFISDGTGKKVVRFNYDGEIIQTYESEKHLNRPVAVTVDRRKARLFVADGFFDHILVFNLEGETLYKMGGRGDQNGDFRNIRSLVQGKRALYIIDGMNRRIQVFGLDGLYLSNFAQNKFNDGAAITTDDEGRFYVIDRMENKIHIFYREELLETFGIRGLGSGEFDSPSGIWYSEGFLYVADTNNRRIQVLKVLNEDTFNALNRAGSLQGLE